MTSDDFEIKLTPKISHEPKSLEWTPTAPLVRLPETDWGNQNVNAQPDKLDDLIPGRFQRITPDRDMEVARTRWQATKAWRKKENIDWILEEPQPCFFVFKKVYPHYYHKKSKDGEYLYIERPGYNHKQTSGLWKQG